MRDHGDVAASNERTRAGFSSDSSTSRRAHLTLSGRVRRTGLSLVQLESHATDPIELISLSLARLRVYFPTKLPSWSSSVASFPRSFASELTDDPL